MKKNKSNLTNQNFDLLSLDLLIEQSFFYSDSVYIIYDSLIFYRENANSALKIYSDSIVLYKNNTKNSFKLNNTFETFQNENLQNMGKINKLHIVATDSTLKNKLVDMVYWGE
ncbi:MAG: hypothetical protein WCK02_13205 [Bacteroidota bacterium]